MTFFSKKTTLKVDLHSHLIPNIDDGSQSIEQSVEMVRSMISLGFSKVITTPHIHPNYPNTPEIILSGLERLQLELKKREIEIEIEAAAEYYVDESFHQKVKDRGLILSFGNKYVLVESSFLNKPMIFEAAMFDLLSAGYIPVLAHPERYRFLEGNLEWLEELKTMGVLLQVTLGSVGGYYGTTPRKVAIELLKKNMVDFLGSDLHRKSHIESMIKGLNTREVQKSLKLERVKNNELL